MVLKSILATRMKKKGGSPLRAFTKIFTKGLFAGWKIYMELVTIVTYGIFPMLQIIFIHTAHL